MIRLTPITKEQAQLILLAQQVQEAIHAIPTPTHGVDGTDGLKGADGAKGSDGITTIVTKEVLANKEALLDKDEFEEFKAMMLKMEQDVRLSLAQTHNYFAGGGAQENKHDLPWHVLDGEERTLATREQAVIHDTFDLEGILFLEGTSQLVLEN